MKAYKEILEKVLTEGKERTDRTGTGTISIRSASFVHDMSEGFPLLTTKKVNFNAVVAELLWFLCGSSNLQDLRDLTHGEGSSAWTIWQPNNDVQSKELGYKNGELGAIYGKQWRQFGQHRKVNGTLQKIDNCKYVDQIANLIEEAKEDPTSRRLLVSAWNPVDLPIMTLPPCHMMFELYVEDGKLDLVWKQRSVDVFLGLSFNIASYATLLLLLAKVLNLGLGVLEGQLTNVHIYNDHIEQVKEQLTREPRDLPQLIVPEINTLEDIEQLVPADFKLVNYSPHPFIKAKMSA